MRLRGREYHIDDESERKVVKADAEGCEYFGTGFGRYFAVEFEDPDARKARIAQEIADRKEADRKARIAIDIPQTSWKEVRDVPAIDPNVIVAWAINNDLENLVKYAKKIDMGSVMICADPEQNHCTKKLHFDNAEVWVHDGRHDKYTTHFFVKLLCGSRWNFEDDFKIETGHTYKYGMTLTAEGVWLNKDGTKWEANYDALND